MSVYLPKDQVKTLKLIFYKYATEKIKKKKQENQVANVRSSSFKKKSKNSTLFLISYFQNSII